MNKEEKRDIYNNKIQRLIKEIDKIIKSSISKADQARSIMARLREEYIFARNRYINKFKGEPFVTIDPYSEDVKPELEEVDTEGICDDDYCRIPTYSFGTFDNEAYFADDVFKIFWLIKEPFCENPDELFEAYWKNDSDYYNQAKSNSSWDNLEYNTHINLVRISQIVLVELAKSKLHDTLNETTKSYLLKLKKEDFDDMNHVMKHICIIEVNHFPGLAFKTKKSKDALIGQWAQLNEELIKKLIEFYNPNVIIGGNTLGHFFPEGYKLIGTGNDHSFDHIKEGIKNGEKIFKKFGLTNLKDKKENVKIKNDYIFNTEEGIVLVDSSHPSRYSKEQSAENSKQIRAFIEEKKTGL